MKMKSATVCLFGILSLHAMNASSQVTPSIECLQDDSPVDGPIKKIFIESDPESNRGLERLVLDFKSYSMTGKITEYTKVLASQISCRSNVLTSEESPEKSILLGAGCFSADSATKVFIQRNKYNTYILTLEKTENGAVSKVTLMNHGTCKVN